MDNCQKFCNTAIFSLPDYPRNFGVETLEHERERDDEVVAVEAVLAGHVEQVLGDDVHVLSRDRRGVDDGRAEAEVPCAEAIQGLETECREDRVRLVEEGSAVVGEAPSAPRRLPPSWM